MYGVLCRLNNTIIYCKFSNSLVMYACINLRGSCPEQETALTEFLRMIQVWKNSVCIGRATQGYKNPFIGELEGRGQT